MRHFGDDYNAIQPFPVGRPKHVKIDGTLVMNVSDHPKLLGKHMDPLIPDDEPVFLIRAKDITAPAVVHYWADMAAEEGAAPELVMAVHAWAGQMEAYAREHYNGGKTPDIDSDLLQK